MTAKLGRFARAVKSARERRGWSQEHLADVSGIGRRTISRWETGDITEPLLSQLREVIGATEIPAEDLLRALDLLPDDHDPRPDLDADEQAIWALGHRRGWPEDVRWELIDVYRAREMRERRAASRDQEMADLIRRAEQ